MAECSCSGSCAADVSPFKVHLAMYLPNAIMKGGGDGNDWNSVNCKSSVRLALQQR